MENASAINGIRGTVLTLELIRRTINELSPANIIAQLSAEIPATKPYRLDNVAANITSPHAITFRSVKRIRT